MIVSTYGETEVFRTTEYEAKNGLMKCKCGWAVNQGIPCVHQLKVLQYFGIMDTTHMNVYVNPLYSVETLKYLLRDFQVFNYVEKHYATFPFFVQEAEGEAEVVE